MSIIDDVQARLKAIDPPVFSIVDDAIALSAVKGRPNATPAAYVFLKEEHAQPNTRMSGGPLLQLVEADIAVVIITDNVSDQTGGAVRTDLETLKAKVRGAVMGMVPPSSDGQAPIEFVSGAVVNFSGGCVWHEQLFGCALMLEEGDDNATF